MPRVLLVIGNDLEQAQQEASATAHMVSALKRAIMLCSSPLVAVEVVTLDQLKVVLPPPALWCPLTIDVPDTLPFPAQAIYQACKNVLERRRYVQQLGYETGDGNFWLPVVLTARGPLYGEVIGLADTAEVVQLTSTNYQQPVHLSDIWRQSLYQMGQRLLSSLTASPGTYLLQFGFQEQTIIFDRLWPFPATPAIASLGVQEPDLFTCHWYCLTGKPILDLTVIPR